MNWFLHMNVPHDFLPAQTIHAHTLLFSSLPLAVLSLCRFTFQSILPSTESGPFFSFPAQSAFSWRFFLHQTNAMWLINGVLKPYSLFSAFLCLHLLGWFFWEENGETPTGFWGFFHYLPSRFGTFCGYFGSVSEWCRGYGHSQEDDQCPSQSKMDGHRRLQMATRAMQLSETCHFYPNWESEFARIPSERTWESLRVATFWVPQEQSHGSISISI